MTKNKELINQIKIKPREHISYLRRYNTKWRPLKATSLPSSSSSSMYFNGGWHTAWWCITATYLLFVNQLNESVASILLNNSSYRLVTLVICGENKPNTIYNLFKSKYFLGFLCKNVVLI